MKVVIFGPRDFHDYDYLCEVIKKSGFEITEVISGCAAGVDRMGETWAKDNKIPLSKFPADWKNLKAKNCLIKDGKYRKYNAYAGFNRNEEMAHYCDAGICIDKNTPGTNHMIKTMEFYKKEVYKG